MLVGRRAGPQPPLRRRDGAPESEAGRCRPKSYGDRRPARRYESIRATFQPRTSATRPAVPHNAAQSLNARSATLNGAWRSLSTTLEPSIQLIRPNSRVLWASAAFSDLRFGLPPQEVEKLHNQLASVLSGEISLKVWHATIAALREARSAADRSDDARPRKWRQSWLDLNGW